MNEEKEVECYVCRGRGKVLWDFPLMEICQTCDGTGKTIITKEEVDKEISRLKSDISYIKDEIQRLAEIFNER